MKSKSYTNQQKTDAIALAHKLGPKKAACKLGIPEGTLSCWRYKSKRAARKGTTWPIPGGGSNEPRIPRLVELEVQPETVVPTSIEPAWELESPLGMLLRVRTGIPPDALAHILLAMGTTETEATL